MSVRGEHTINGRTFAVVQSCFIEVFANMTFTQRGTVLNDGHIVTMVSSAQQLLLASAGTAYVFNLQTSAFAAIPGATFSGQVSQVGYADGFFIALIADTNTFYISGPLDANDWTTNGAALVSVFPDNLVGMLVDHRELWFWSATQSIVYFDSGNIFPFDVVSGGSIEQGLAAKFSQVKLDNTIFWLGSDARGTGVVWRAQGYTPRRVSNHAIEFAIQGYSRIDDAVAYSFQMEGHYFYHLYFPTPSKSWRYDTATGLWHEVAYLEQATGRFTAHRSQVHTFNFGKHLVGDWNSNKLYDMEIPVEDGRGGWLFADDDGNPIRRVRHAPHLSKDQKYQTHHQLQVYLESGLGPTPALVSTEAPVGLTLNDANGITWNVSIDDIGVLNTNLGFGTVQSLILTDVTVTTSWRVTVDTLGGITTTSVPLDPGNVQVFSMSSGITRWIIYVDNLGVLITSFFENVTRAPMLNLRWSDDGGHAYSNEYSAGMGKTGEFSNRVMYRRLGRSRDRVYEISGSDPVPYRVIGGFIEVGA